MRVFVWAVIALSLYGWALIAWAIGMGSSPRHVTFEDGPLDGEHLIYPKRMVRKLPVRYSLLTPLAAAHDAEGDGITGTFDEVSIHHYRKTFRDEESDDLVYI